MNFIKERKKLIVIIAMVVIVIAIPLTVILLQKQQDIRQHAASATTLTFSPTTSAASPLQTTVNNTFSLDMKVDPGTNAISVVKYEITYDSTKLAVDTTAPFTQNKTSFPTSLEGPFYSSGKISGTVSIGSDYSKAIVAATTVATVKFKTLTATTTIPIQISYSTKSQLLSVSSQTQAAQNVLSSTTPAYININKDATACTLDQPTDVLMLIDKSGSMGPPVSTDDRITPAKTAAKNFVNLLYENGLNQTSSSKSQVGVVSFAQLLNSTQGRTTLDAPLTLLSAKTNVDSLNSKIQAISIFGRTCIQCAVALANTEIAAHGRTGVKKVVILLTDGGADAYDGHLTSDQATAEKAANDEIDKGHTQSGTIFFTIGLGTSVNTSFLKNVASRTGGQYYYAPTGSDLTKIYGQISTSIAKGIISGTVFNDTNANSHLDTGESGLSNWSVQATLNGQTVAATKSDSTGEYTFQNLCDGTYTVALSSSTAGWTVTTGTITATIRNGNAVVDKNIGLHVQAATPTPTKVNTPTPTKVPTPTQPPAPTLTLTGNPLSIPFAGTTTLTWSTTNATSCTSSVAWTGERPTSGTITTGALTATQNYVLVCTGPGGSVTKTVTITVGAQPILTPTPTPIPTATPTPVPTNTPVPTATPVPQATKFAFTVYMHGIGHSGDNANPTAFSLSNQNPIRQQRTLTVDVINTQGTTVDTKSGLITYDTANGDFTGSIDMGSSLANGSYNIKIKAPQYLKKQIAGIQTVTPGQTITMPAVTLVTGDINGDNALNILDYDVIIGCYSDFAPAVSCSGTQNVDADLTDDGQVDQFDYNLFLRDLSVQNGD